MGQRRPDGSIVDISSGESVVVVAVQVPCNGLRSPVVVCEIDRNAPGVETVGRHGSCAGAADGLVARAAKGGPAVDGTIAGKKSVDLFHDIYFSSSRPLGTVAHSIAESPEGRPDTLLVRVVS